jgi:hypothetical protein
MPTTPVCSCRACWACKYRQLTRQGGRQHAGHGAGSGMQEACVVCSPTYNGEVLRPSRQGDVRPLHSTCQHTTQQWHEPQHTAGPARPSFSCRLCGFVAGKQLACNCNACAGRLTHTPGSHRHCVLWCQLTLYRVIRMAQLPDSTGGGLGQRAGAPRSAACRSWLGVGGGTSSGSWPLHTLMMTPKMRAVMFLTLRKWTGQASQSRAGLKR